VLPTLIHASSSRFEAEYFGSAGESAHDAKATGCLHKLW